MKNIAALPLALALSAGLFSMPTLAAGDAQAGEKVFSACAAAATRSASRLAPSLVRSSMA